jgi:hypothetical protein
MIKKLFVFAAINLVIAGIAAMAPPSLTNTDDYARTAAVHQFVETEPPGTTVNAILGDSRSDCCIAAQDIGFVNLSYQGASPVEGYYVLHRALERGVRFDRIMLSYGPFHIFTQDAFHSQTRYFGLVDEGFLDTVLEQAQELDDREYLQYNWKALEVMDDAMPWLPDWLKFRLINVASMNRTLAAFGRYAWKEISASEVVDVAHADPLLTLHTATPADRQNVGGESPEYEKPNAISPVNELYLRKIVDLARENHIDVHYLVMPFNRDVLHPDKAYYDHYYRILEDAGLTGCYGPAHWWPNEFFADPHHLNVQGARRMAAKLHDSLSYCSW